VLNVHRVNDVRQMDIHTAEPLVPEPSLVEVEIAIGKLKSYKSQSTDNSLAKLIKAGGEILCSEIHNIYGIRRNFHSSGSNLLLYKFFKRVIRLTVIIMGNILLINCLRNFIQYASGHVNSICQ
jgi:hypothetical protein